MTGLNYILRPATTTEIEDIRRLHVEMWAKGLELEQYLARERSLESATLTRNGGLRTWVLVSPSSPNTVLSSCETIQKDIVISRPPKMCVDSQSNLYEGVAHGIGSVFTPKDKRGNGYASIMLRLLSDTLERENEKGFSVLFSDIGKNFYARKGWKPHPDAQLDIPIFKPSLIRNARYIRASELPDLCQKDIDVTREKLLVPTDHTRIAFLPDWKTMEWHHTREEFIGPIARPHMKIKPEFKGAISPDGKRWMIWNRDYLGEPLLYILRIARITSDSEEDPEKGIQDMADLFRAASAEAERWGLDRIIVWNPDTETLEAAKRLEGANFVYSNRDDTSIPCLKMHEDPTDDVEWVGNEKYTWC